MSSYNITNLRSELRIALGNLDTTDLSNSDADLLLNRAKWELEESLDLRVSIVHTTLNTVAGTFSYAQAFPIDAILTLSLNDTDEEKWVPLIRIDEDDYNNNYSTKTTDQGKPTHFFMRGNNLIFWPTPDAIYSIEGTRKETITDLSDNNTTIAFSPALTDILLQIAIGKGFSRMRDFNSYFRQRAVVKEAIKVYVTPQVKEQSNWHHAQVSPIVNRYEPN